MSGQTLQHDDIECCLFLFLNAVYRSVNCLSRDAFLFPSFKPTNISANILIVKEWLKLSLARVKVGNNLENTKHLVGQKCFFNGTA